MRLIHCTQKLLNELKVTDPELLLNICAGSSPVHPATATGCFILHFLSLPIFHSVFLCQQSGEHPFIVSKMLGHSSMKITEGYAHSDIESLRADIEKISLNGKGNKVMEGKFHIG